MCTVSIVAHRTGVRIVCNRDERRDRPLAEPPEVRTHGGVRTVFPVDPFSGGTWIGANEERVAMVLLNRNPRARRPVGARTRSRGTIIPEVLPLGSLMRVTRAVDRLDADCFEPFTLLVVQGQAIAVIRNVEGRIETRSSSIAHPLVFTSSSLGDHLASVPRRVLFKRMVRDHPQPLRGQSLYHRHVWTERPEISVCMSRSDASTVSRTVIDMDRAGIRMSYTPLESPASIVSASLPHVQSV